MKTFLLFIVVISLSITEVVAQSPLREDGNQFKLATGYNVSGIPIYISYEMGIFDNITFGIEVSYRSYSEDTDSMTLYHSIAGLSFYGNYYFNELLKIDSDKWFLYGGVNLGYYKWFSPDNYFELGKSTSTLAIGVQIGGAYYFKDWGLYLEGVGNTENAGVKLGVLYRFVY